MTTSTRTTSSAPGGLSAAHVDALIELGARALARTSLDEVFAFAAEVVAEHLHVPRVGVFERADAEGHALRLRAGVGWRVEHPGRFTIVGAPATGGGPSFVGGAQGGAAVHPDALLSLGVLRSVSVAITADASPFGVIAAFADDADGSFDQTAVDLLGAASRILGAAVARTRVEDSLRSSEQRLALAQRIAHLGSYDWDIATDTNTWSDELYRIYGAEPQSFNASYERFLGFIHPDDREAIIAVHQRALADHQPYQMEERIVWPDGSIRILESNGEVILDAEGNPARMVGICLDVTERREEQERARRWEQAQAARRQAFELNDGVVQGLATIVYALECDRTDLARAAADAALRAARSMIHDLIPDADAASIGPGSLRREEPARSLDRAVLEVREDAREPITVVLADDADDMRFLLRQTLGLAAGFRVVGEAADGVEAVAVVAATAPDVVVLDLAMPRLDGLEAARVIRKRVPGTRIVVLSGFGSEQVRAGTADRDVDLFIEKGAPLSSIGPEIKALLAAPAAEVAPGH